MMVLIHDLVEIDAGDTFVYDDAAPARTRPSVNRPRPTRLFALLPNDQGLENQSPLGGVQDAGDHRRPVRRRPRSAPADAAERRQRGGAGATTGSPPLGAGRNAHIVEGHRRSGVAALGPHRTTRSPWPPSPTRLPSKPSSKRHLYDPAGELPRSGAVRGRALRLIVVRGVQNDDRWGQTDGLGKSMFSLVASSEPQAPR